MKYKDERLKLMSDVLSGIKVLKVICIKFLDYSLSSDFLITIDSQRHSMQIFDRKTLHTVFFMDQSLQ